MSITERVTMPLFQANVGNDDERLGCDDAGLANKGPKPFRVHASSSTNISTSGKLLSHNIQKNSC